MIPVPTGVRVWLATGHTDMRKGFASLSLQVQEILKRDPLSGQLFCFRGRSGMTAKGPVYQAAGAGPLPVAERSRRRGDDLLGAARLSAIRDRLAPSSGNLASDLGRLTVFACRSRRM
jgi:transposase